MNEWDRVRTTMGGLRRALQEAGKRFGSHDGFNAGDWVMTRDRRGREHAGQIKGFSTLQIPDHPAFVLITVGYGGHSSEERYDIWKKDTYAGPATSADIEQAKEEWAADTARTAAVIDTSRQGT